MAVASSRGCRAARACDALLAFCMLVLAAWTVAYHTCLLLGLGSAWALAALVASVLPAGVVAIRAGAPAGPVPVAHGPGPRPDVIAGAGVAAALAVAVEIAFARPPWPLTWALWLLAAAVVLWACARRPPGLPGGARPGAAVALAWACALAGLALLLVKPNSDDAYYVRQAAWIADHGRFPLGDTLHSDDVLPAAFSPPLPSIEPLVGAAARVTGLSAPGVAYLALAPLAAALAVLALWRLLRTWQVRMVGPALTVALVFLLTAVEPADHPDADIGHLPGDFFVARAWQGKVVLVTVLVPLLFSLLHDHAARPRRAGVALLAAAGCAGVGLSTTATFLVPLVAAACLAPLARRAPLRAAAGFAAASAYPLAGMAAAMLSDGHQPARWTPRDIAPQALVLPALGTGAVALVAVVAALAGPLLLAPRHARLGVAGAGLAVAVVFAPGAPELLYALTGLGRPVWRLMWALPVAALVGVLATQPAAGHQRAAVRLLPGLAVVALLALAGTPVWEGRNTVLAGRPALKRGAGELAAARRLARLTRPGDLVLAPAGLGQTLLMLDGRVFAVAPRALYTRALPGGPAARRRERLLLGSFVHAGLFPGAQAAEVRAALRTLDVDVACVRAVAVRSRRLLERAGFRPFAAVSGYWCGAVR